MFRWCRNAARPLSRLSAALALLLGLAACAKREDTSPSLLRLSQRNEPATLDPHLATLPDEPALIRTLLEGLVVPNPNEGPPLPGVAETWSVSRDGLEWTFQLRPDARWSNGDPVTAADFVYSFRRALDPALASPKASLLFALKNAAAINRGAVRDPAQLGATAPNDRTLVLTLEQPTPQLLALAASGEWLPVHRTTVEKFRGANARDGAWATPGRFVGNGPFVLTEWRKGQHLLLTRNPRFHSASLIKVSAVRFQIYDNGDTEERAFRARQVDVTMAVPFAKLDNYEAPVLRRQPLHETRYFALNTRRQPLDDPRVRKALALAIDRDALVQNVLRGGQQTALHFIPPGLGGYTSHAHLDPNPDSARALLAEAGFPGGRGFPKLELSTWVNTPVLEAVQQMWRRELGIETAIVQREAKVHIAALGNGDFAIGFMPAIPDYDDAAALFDEWKPGAPGNYARWSDGRYDELVNEAAHETDWEKRVGIYRDAERRLLEELPVIPLYFNAQNYLVAPSVQGWRQDALWNRFFQDVTLSHENSSRFGSAARDSDRDR